MDTAEEERWCMENAGVARTQGCVCVAARVLVRKDSGTGRTCVCACARARVCVRVCVLVREDSCAGSLSRHAAALLNVV